VKSTDIEGDEPENSEEQYMCKPRARGISKCYALSVWQCQTGAIDWRRPRPIVSLYGGDARNEEGLFVETYRRKRAVIEGSKTL
jgi:hypothetical protein